MSMLLSYRVVQFKKCLHLFMLYGCSFTRNIQLRPQHKPGIITEESVKVVGSPIQLDLEMLHKFQDGGYVSERDLPRVEELASIGLLKMGLSLKKMMPTAKTTSLGKKYL